MSLGGPGELSPLVSAAQRVAGIVAARGRGDDAGAQQLIASFDDATELAGGAMLVAELSLGLLRRERGESLEDRVNDLCVAMEAAVG